MEFGKVQDPNHINFLLPPDHPMTDELLKELSFQPKDELRIHVGATRWRVKEWIGTVYPKKTKEKDFLSQYVRQFNTIELNATWYNLQPKEVIEKWAGLADRGFRYWYCHHRHIRQKGCRTYAADGARGLYPLGIQQRALN